MLQTLNVEARGSIGLRQLTEQEAAFVSGGDLPDMHFDTVDNAIVAEAQPGQLIMFTGSTEDWLDDSDWHSSGVGYEKWKWEDYGAFVEVYFWANGQWHSWTITYYGGGC